MEDLEDLSEFCLPKKIGPCSRVSLVGNNIKSFFPELGVVLETFRDKKCYLISQASNELNFSFLISEKDVDLIVEKIHSLCFGGIFDEVTLGSTWQSLFSIQVYLRPAVPITWKAAF